MKNSKNTRRALVSSALAILLCVTMLVGNTFAWFTDTASTSVNKIQAGTLDIALEMQNKDGEWESVEGKTIDFVKAEGHEDEEILWEPGCSYYTDDFRIVNNGNLALKFKVLITGIDGDAKLNEAIEWSFLSARDNENYDPDEYLSFPYTWSWKNTDGEESYEPLDDEFVLLPGECVYMQLIGEMDKEAGNEYQGLSIEGAAITVYATQYTYEYDSNDNQYDANATYLNKDTTDAWVINTVDELVYFAYTVNSGKTYEGETVKLNADLDLTGIDWTPIGLRDGSKSSVPFKGTFDGQNHTVKNLNVTSYYDAGLFGTTIVATIKNVKVENATVNGNNHAGAIVAHGVCTHVDNCHVTNATVTVSVYNNDDGDKAGAIMGYNSAESTASITNCSATDCTIIGYRDIGGIVGYINNGTTFTGNTVKDVTIVIDNSHDYKDYGTDKSQYDAGALVGDGGDSYNINIPTATVVFVAKDDNSVNTAIENGDTTVYLGDGEFIIPDSAKGKTLTIVGNGNSSVAVQNDGSNEYCDYSFDGATVTFENVTITTDSHTYAGYARLSATYNNCTINGTYTLYGKSVFNNCTFNVSGDLYNVWTWGAEEVEFNDCTFNSSGKSVLLYGGTSTKLTAKNCVFNDANDYANVNNKAAIETGCDWKNAGYVKEIIAENCTVNGFDVTNKGTHTGSTLWGNKNDLSSDALKVTVDGVKVY